MLQATNDGVIHSALQNDADGPGFGSEMLVESVRLDELNGSGPALLDLEFFMDEGGWRQHDPIDVADRVFQRLFQSEIGLAVFLRHKATMDVAGPDPHLDHHRRVRGFRQFEGLFDHVNHGRQIRARIHKPDLRFHRISVAALLHDRGTFAVILADDDHGAAIDATRGQVRQRVARDIRAGRRFPRHRATDRIHDRGRQHRSSGCLGRRTLKMHAEFRHVVGSVSQNIHQMGNRRALIAADIGHARLQKGFGDRQNTFAAKFMAVSQPQVFDFSRERSLGHRYPPRFKRPYACKFI